MSLAEEIKKKGMAVTYFFESQPQTLKDALAGMDNEERLETVKKIFELRREAVRNCGEKSKEARVELAKVFDEEKIDDHPICQGENRVMFSLGSTPWSGVRNEPYQFRAWYAPFGNVHGGHFDSCGHGFFFQANSIDYQTLLSWARALVGNMREWQDRFGNIIWVGFN